MHNQQANNLSTLVLGQDGIGYSHMVTVFISSVFCFLDRRVEDNHKHGVEDGGWEASTEGIANGEVNVLDVFIGQWNFALEVHIEDETSGCHGIIGWPFTGVGRDVLGVLEVFHVFGNGGDEFGP